MFCHVQSSDTTFMEQQEGCIWFKESHDMEKHYKLPKSEQSFPRSNCCFDKEWWLQTMEQTKL